MARIYGKPLTAVPDLRKQKSVTSIERGRARILVMPSESDVRRQLLHDRDRDEFLELESLYFRIKNRIADRARLSTDSPA